MQINFCLFTALVRTLHYHEKNKEKKKDCICVLNSRVEDRESQQQPQTENGPGWALSSQRIYKGRCRVLRIYNQEMEGN